jgi:hypothetical protein
MNNLPLWSPVLTGPARQATLSVVSQALQRLRPPAVRQTLAASGRPGGWPAALADGYAGIALLFGQLDRCFPDRGWDHEAHTYLALAAQEVEAAPADGIGPGLWGGLSGLCYTVHFLARGETRYRRLLATLDARLVQQLTVELAYPASAANALADCDRISGAAEVLAYLLERPAAPSLRSLRDALLDWLIAWSASPGYVVPPPRQAARHPHAPYGHEATGSGLAHRAPGPLAVLALAHRQGIARPGLAAAVRTLADWMMTQSSEAAWGPSWPEGGSSPPPALLRPVAQAVWCQNRPGVARALWLAGVALADSALCAAALVTLEAVHRRRTVGEIGSPILCHGGAGLLQIVLRFAADTGRADLAAWAADLAASLSDLFDPTTPLGFQERVPGGERRDRPGLLDGATGVILPLLAAATDTPPTWDRILLLA